MIKNKEKKTVSVSEANFLGILFILPFIILYFLLFYFLNYNDNTLPNLGKSLRDSAESYGASSLSLLILGIAIIGVVIHELIHGIC